MYKGLVFLLWVGVLACSNTSDRESRSAAEGASNFEIALSSGGGFTGLYRGCRLYADGRVEAWQERGGGDSLLWQRSVDVELVEKLRGKLLKSGALGRPHNTAGNMTVAIVYATADTSYRWSWDQSKGAPAELAAWYQETRSFCASSAPR